MDDQGALSQGSEGHDDRGYGWARKSSQDPNERSDDEENQENYKFTGGTKNTDPDEQQAYLERYGGSKKSSQVTTPGTKGRKAKSQMKAHGANSGFQSGSYLPSK